LSAIGGIKSKIKAEVRDVGVVSGKKFFLREVLSV